MRKYLTVISILLVLLAGACSPKPAATTVAPTRALPTHTSAPATLAPTKAATSAASSPAPTTSSTGSTPAATSSAGSTPAATSGTPSASAGTGTPGIPVTGLSAKISVADVPGLGSVLVDNTGMPLYMFKSDKQNGGTSACDLTCIMTWPPLITVSAPVAGEGVDASMLGTITLKSGLLQVTYNGWPLYHYLPDASLPANRRGQASGQGVQGKWFVMGPDGNPISTLLPTAAPTAAAATATP